jgi:hypothetical protein
MVATNHDGVVNSLSKSAGMVVYAYEAMVSTRIYRLSRNTSRSSNCVAQHSRGGAHAVYTGLGRFNKGCDCVCAGPMSGIWSSHVHSMHMMWLQCGRNVRRGDSPGHRPQRRGQGESTMCIGLPHVLCSIYKSHAPLSRHPAAHVNTCPLRSMATWHTGQRGGRRLRKCCAPIGHFDRRWHSRESE